jgi:hypothetical protein
MASQQKFLNAGLRALGVALILIPEPFTTPIGIGILARAGRSGKPGPAGSPVNTLLPYSYRLCEEIQGTITYEVYETQVGQLPSPAPFRSVPLDGSHPTTVKSRPPGQFYSGSNDPVGLMKRPVYQLPTPTPPSSR